MTPSPARHDPQLRVLDLTAPQRAVKVQFDVSPAYEVLAALQAVSSPEEWPTYTQGTAWYDDFRSRMSTELRELIDRQSGPDLHVKSEWAHLTGLVSEAPDRANLGAVIDHIASLPTAVVYRALLVSALNGASRRENADLLDAAAEGDKAARQRLREIAEDEGHDTACELLESLLERDAGDIRDGIILGLREAATLLADHLAAVMPALHHDAEVRRESVRGLSAEEAVEVGTNGIHWVPETGIRRILLVPQAAMRPWVCIGEHGDTKIFLVAVGDESLSADLDSPPARLLGVLKALGEEQRLRILRRLAVGGPMSLQQVAEHIGVAKSTAHHHMVQLRAAGLTIVDLGADRDFRIRDGLATDVGQLLDTYLRGGAR
jgi:DNA-binding transcriptional ArsR family regulator